MYSRHIFAEFDILLRGIASNKNESINGKVNETIKNMLELDTREGASRMIIKFVKFNLEIKKKARNNYCNISTFCSNKK